MVGGTQHHVLCATSNSQACSEHSCGHGRGRPVREARNERFVKFLYGCHLDTATVKMVGFLAKTMAVLCAHGAVRQASGTLVLGLY